MSESAKLTIKVKLHAAPPALPADLPPVAVTSQWSVPRIVSALVVLLLLSVAAWWLLASPSTEQDKKPTTTPAINLAKPLDNSAQLQASDTAATSTSEQAEPIPTAVASSAFAAETSAVVAEATTAPVSTSAKPEATAASTLLPKGFSRIVLTDQMERLEPGRSLQHQVAQRQIQRLYLFTELRGYAGQQLFHRWWFQNELVTEVLLTIEDSPWRTYSEKWLLPTQTGQWRVQILDQAQNVLYQHDFQYQ